MDGFPKQAFDQFPSLLNGFEFKDALRASIIFMSTFEEHIS